MRIASFNIENLVPWIRDDDGMRRMHGALRGYVCHASLPRDQRNVSYRGGRAYGVATYVRSSLRAKPVHVPEWDREGRVVVTSLDAFTIINVYLVNGTSRPYFEPDTGNVAGDRHAFKRKHSIRSSSSAISTCRARRSTSIRAFARRGRTRSRARS